MSEEKEKKQEKKEFVVVEVPTEHRQLIQTPEGELMNEMQLLTKIANDIDTLRAGLVG